MGLNTGPAFSGPVSYSPQPYGKDILRLNGTVKFRNYTRGFGFIAPENGD